MATYSETKTTPGGTTHWNIFTGSVVLHEAYLWAAIPSDYKGNFDFNLSHVCVGRDMTVARSRSSRP